MNRREALVRLVAGQLPVVRDVTVLQPREIENAVDNAEALLAEIEKACPEEDKSDRLAALDRKLSAEEDIREAVAAQREKDAKIAENYRFVAQENALQGIAAAIRGGEK